MSSWMIPFPLYILAISRQARWLTAKSKLRLCVLCVRLLFSFPIQNFLQASSGKGRRWCQFEQALILLFLLRMRTAARFQKFYLLEFWLNILTWMDACLLSCVDYWGKLQICMVKSSNVETLFWTSFFMLCGLSQEGVRSPFSRKDSERIISIWLASGQKTGTRGLTLSREHASGIKIFSHTRKDAWNKDMKTWMEFGLQSIACAHRRRNLHRQAREVSVLDTTNDGCSKILFLVSFFGKVRLIIFGSAAQFHLWRIHLRHF